MSNKVFAQSSINQVKLVKESEKYHSLLFDDIDLEQETVYNPFSSAVKPGTVSALSQFAANTGFATLPTSHANISIQ